MEIEIGKSYLRKISHEGGEISFQYPAFKGTYENVGKQIEENGLLKPTPEQTASLVYSAYENSDDNKYSKEIISILKGNWLWEFTGNLYLPKSNEEINNGVILEYNPTITNGKLKMDKNSLVQRLKTNDSLVKFVPFGYKTGSQNLIEFQKNPYIIARYGKEGAGKIAEVASKYKNNPHIWSFNSVNEEKTRMSALGDSWSFGYRLDVDGNDWGGDDVGHSFGVKK